MHLFIIKFISCHFFRLFKSNVIYTKKTIFILIIRIVLFLYSYRNKENDNELVLKQCKEIISTIPVKIEPSFEKGKHLTLSEALLALQVKLGDKYYENSALLSILRQEIDCYNKLLEVIHKSVQDLTKAIKGEIMITKILENTFESLLIQKVPEDWRV